MRPASSINSNAIEYQALYAQLIERYNTVLKENEDKEREVLFIELEKGMDPEKKPEKRSSKNIRKEKL